MVLVGLCYFHTYCRNLRRVFGERVGPGVSVGWVEERKGKERRGERQTLEKVERASCTSGASLRASCLDFSLLVARSGAPVVADSRGGGRKKKRRKAMNQYLNGVEVLSEV